MPSPAQTERELFRRNVWRRTLLSAGIPAAVVFVLCANYSGLERGVFWGACMAIGLFWGIGFWAAIIFYFVEKKASKIRLNERAENEYLAQEQAEQAEKIRREQARQEAVLYGIQQEQAMMDAQAKRDSREFILKTLAHVNACIDIYEPSNPELSVPIKRAISKDLTEILVKHTRAELAGIIAQEPEVRGMFIDVENRLREKHIDSPEAAQVFVVVA